jgi:hypothetical protein
MKNSINKVRIQIILLAVIVVGMLATAPATAQDKHIDVSVQDGKLVFLNSECPHRPQDMGCVLADRGESPVISWSLSGSDGADWTFVGLEFAPLPLADCTVEDFGLSEADRQSGEASTAQIVAGGKRIQIRDRNRNQCITQYTLTARSSDGTEIDSDPVVENRGGGRN